MRTLCRAAALLAALPLLMGAEAFRWVDADGVVNFTQRQPVGVAAERVAAQPAPPSGIALTAVPADPAATSDDTAADAPPHDPQAVAQLQRADCEKARDVLEQLTSRGRVRVRGADGVERVLPEEERQARIGEVQEAIATHCGDSASR